MKCVGGIYGALKTQATPKQKLEDIAERHSTLGEGRGRARPAALCCHSFTPKPPPDPSQEELQKRLKERLGRHKNAALPLTDSTVVPLFPANTTAPPTH